MNAERILLPLNIRRCPLSVFPEVNKVVTAPRATVVLLHVVALNIAMAENRVYEQLGRDARWYLERLARACLRPGIRYITRIRFGSPVVEILAEAVGKVELVVLPSYAPSVCDRIFGLILPSIAEQVSRNVRCLVFRPRKEDQFNCEDVWGRSSQRGIFPSGLFEPPFRTDERLPVSRPTTVPAPPEEHRSAA